MMGWLGDTEGMVAAQKPPSTDYKVVKAQVAEQKFLQRMIDDRAGSVTNMEEIGREIAMSGKPGDSDPQHVEEQMAQLLGMFGIIFIVAMLLNKVPYDPTNAVCNHYLENLRMGQSCEYMVSQHNSVYHVVAKYERFK